MTTFERMGLFERLHRALLPRYRRRREAEMLDALRYLCRNPDLPCVVAGEVIPHGYGGSAPSAKNA